MKLMVAIVHRDDANSVSDALAAAGFELTRLKTVGGFLGRSNETLLLGMDDTRVDEAVDLLRRHGRGRVEELATPLAAEAVGVFVPVPVEVEVGGATVFVVDVDRFERL